MSEEQVQQIDDDYAGSSLGEREVAALRLTDAIIGVTRGVTPEVQRALHAGFTAPEIVELALGVALFLALSKALITLGLEPESMPTTVLPTPGSPRHG